MEGREGDTSMKIPVEKIVIPEVRVSAQFTSEQLEHFKASVGELGVIQDPVVRPLPDGRYELIAGASRFRELCSRGAVEVECKVVETDEKSSIAMNITENLARGTYDPIEVSCQLNNFLSHGGTIEELVRMTGHTKEWVMLYLHLSELPENYQRALSEGKLRIGHVQAAIQLDDPREIDAALSTAVSLDWPVSTMERYVERRASELEMMRATRETGIPPPVPTVEEAAEKVRYSVCGICHRTVENRFITVPGTCQECIEFTRYATQLVGTGHEAMTRLYQAVTHYHQFLQMQQEMLKQVRPPPSTGQTPTPPE